MSVAYVDTSVLVAIEFDEQHAEVLDKRLSQHSIVSSMLMEAEYQSVCARENHQPSNHRLEAIDWILPDRSLTPEINKALAAGYLRGADLFHVATALYVKKLQLSSAMLHSSHWIRNKETPPYC